MTTAIATSTGTPTRLPTATATAAATAETEAPQALGATASAAEVAAAPPSLDSFENGGTATPLPNACNGQSPVHSDLPMFRINPATGQPLALTASATAGAGFASADGKTAGAATGTVEGTLGLQGGSVGASGDACLEHVGDNTQASAGLHADSRSGVVAEGQVHRQSDNASLDARGSLNSRGAFALDAHGQAQSKDGKTAGSVGAHADNAGAELVLDGRHEGSQGFVQGHAEARSDGTFDLDARGAGETKDGKLSGEFHVEADETGASGQASAALRTEKVDADLSLQGDTRTGTGQARLDVDAGAVTGNAWVKGDPSGVDAGAAIAVDGKHVDADAKVAVVNGQLDAEANLSARTADGHAGLDATVGVSGSVNGSFDPQVNGSASGFVGTGAVQVFAGVEGATGEPLQATAGLRAQDKTGSVGAFVQGSVQGPETAVTAGIELRPKKKR